MIRESTGNESGSGSGYGYGYGNKLTKKINTIWNEKYIIIGYWGTFLQQRTHW